MVFGFDGSRAFVAGKTGTENYSYQLLKALAEIDKKNQYIVYLRPNYSSSEERSNESRSYLKDINILKEGSRLRSNNIKGWPENFQFKVINWPRLWTQGGLAKQTFRDKLDVLFVPAHTLPVIRKPGLKTVVTVHDLGSEYLPSMHQVKQRVYLDFMQKFQLRTATRIVAVSNATKKDLIKKIGLDSKKVSVTYEGYDKALYKRVSSDALVNSLRQYGLQDEKYFLFVGTIQPRKNLGRLIKAFSNFIARGPASSASRRASSLANRSLRLRAGTPSSLSPLAAETIPVALVGSSVAPLLVLAGSKGWLSDEIFNLPKKLGIEDKVKFLGYVPDKNLSALYSGAEALLFPSLFEGFGLPILEAQASGCPVLTSNISSMPEVAGEGAIFVDPYFVGDIVKGMIRINNQDTRNKLIKAGYENIKRFSWEKCAIQTLEVLESL